MNPSELKEVLKCGEQVLHVTGEDTETATIQNSHEISQQLMALREKQRLQIKQDIIYLTSTVNVSSDAGDSADGSLSSSDLNNKEAELQAKVKAVHSQSETLNKERQQLNEQLTKAQKEQQTLREQRQTEKEAKLAALPVARCDHNLYRNITNLRWQFNCAPHEVKGLQDICNTDVKTFSLSSQEVSRFYITNYLWDLIEEDW